MSMLNEFNCNSLKESKLAHFLWNLSYYYDLDHVFLNECIKDPTLDSSVIRNQLVDLGLNIRYKNNIPKSLEIKNNDSMKLFIREDFCQLKADTESLVDSTKIDVFDDEFVIAVFGNYSEVNKFYLGQLLSELVNYKCTIITFNSERLCNHFKLNKTFKCNIANVSGFKSLVALLKVCNKLLILPDSLDYYFLYGTLMDKVCHTYLNSDLRSISHLPLNIVRHTSLDKPKYVKEFLYTQFDTYSDPHETIYITNSFFKFYNLIDKELRLMKVAS